MWSGSFCFVTMIFVPTQNGETDSTQPGATCWVMSEGGWEGVLLFSLNYRLTGRYSGN